MLAAHLHGVALRLVQGNLPVGQVALVACDDDGSLGGQVALQLLHPHVHFRPALQVGDVVHDQGPLCALVVHLVQCVVPLLSRGVPDVEGDLVAAGHLDRLGEAAGVHCADLLLVEVAATKAECEGGLADTGLPQHDHLEGGLRCALFLHCDLLLIINILFALIIINDTATYNYIIATTNDRHYHRRGQGALTPREASANAITRREQGEAAAIPKREHHREPQGVLAQDGLWGETPSIRRLHSQRALTPVY